MKTNSLTHTINVNNKKVNCIVKIRLNDECKNGHQDFSITGTFWEIGKFRNDRNMTNAGCCHDEILAHFPELKIFVDLHLSDCKGRPMYAVENGRYHFNNTSFEVGRDYLRLTDKQAKKLYAFAHDKDYFAYLLENMGILQIWENEANEAIKMLEKLTGNKFVNDSTRYQYEPLSEEKKNEIRLKYANGFYSPESVELRKSEEANRELQKKIDEVNNYADAKIKDLNNERFVKLELLNKGFSLDNFIYYNHNNTGIFNWLDYKPKISKSELENIVNSLDFSTLPKDIQFKLK